MKFLDHLRIDFVDVLALTFVIFYVICKVNHIDTAIDAAIAMIIAFYFGSKHNHKNKE